MRQLVHRRRSRSRCSGQLQAGEREDSFGPLGQMEGVGEEARSQLGDTGRGLIDPQFEGRETGVGHSWATLVPPVNGTNIPNVIHFLIQSLWADAHQSDCVGVDKVLN